MRTGADARIMGDTIAKIRDMRPVVGLTSRTVRLRATASPRLAETLARGYVEAVERAGGLALMLPNTGPERAGDYLDRIDALILTGGDDPHPRLFGEQPHPKLEAVDERRDLLEIELARGARARGMPLFGICRGIQILNVACGGGLIQDIASQAPRAIGHSQTTIGDQLWHEVEVAPKSLLERLVGGSPLRVNSFHHQACREAGEGLVATATAIGDGLIEALEDPGAPFLLAVQWHPEVSEATGDEASRALFAGLVAAASSN